MKISCNTANDLLPLYVEGMASKESAALVEKHIAECPVCAAGLEEMKAAASQTGYETRSADELAPLSAIKKEITMRRRMTAAICVLLALTAVTALFSFLTARRYIPYSPELISAEQLTENTIRVTYTGATGFGTTLCFYDDVPCSERTEEIELWYTILDRMLDKSSSEETHTLYFENVSAVDYCDLAADGELIRIYGRERDGGCVVLERLALTYYLFMAVLALLVFGILRLVFRKKRFGKRMRFLLPAPAAYILAHIIISFTVPYTYTISESFGYILLIAAMLYTAAVLGIRLKERA